MTEVKAMLSQTLPRLGSQAGVSYSGYVTRARSWVHQTFCALHGHDLMIHFERGRRVCLRCAECGHETPGWQTK
jgi:hypothetical protein